MKRKALMVSGGIIVVVAGLLLYNLWQPEFLTRGTLAQALEHQKVAANEAAPAPKPTEQAKSETAKPAATDANVVKVKFDTSKGVFVVEVHKDWAPKGAARFLELVKAGYYNDNRFFRVVPGFVVQWGISGDPQVAGKWMNKNITDDPVTQSNVPGTITFAAARPNTRSVQVFINYGNNSRLDAMGFAPFGKVIEGMDVVRSLESKYNERPTSAQGQIAAAGNAWLDSQFPGLDYIKTATIE